MQLYIGNKNYSSWSMRPWVLMRHYDIEFEEAFLPLYLPDSKQKIQAVSPSGKVPCLVDGARVVWDSLAICEYLAEKYPQLQLWPESPGQRARARSISCEMHAGFADLRSALSMNIRCTFPAQIWADRVNADAVRRDLSRIFDIWQDCLERSDGFFLFGKFGIADAMFAPVVMRLLTYAIDVPQSLAEYVRAVHELPAVQAWVGGALAEHLVIPQFEQY